MEVSVLQCVCVPDACGERAGSDMNRSDIFPQGVVASITLVVDRAGDEGIGPELTVRQCFLSTHCPSLPYWGWGWIPSLRSRSLEY